MRLLVVARHFAALRNYESVVRRLLQDGQDVEVAALQEDAVGGAAMVARWQAEFPALRVSWAPGRPVSESETLTEKIRLALDWVRYLAPAYRTAPRLVSRARERTPRVMLWLTALPGMGTAPARRALTAGLREIERTLPRVPAVDAFLAQRQPDVVMLTPLIGLGSPELDYLRSARALGFRTLFGVWSWDNLSSKALIRWVPDVIAVWNETQRDEAVTLHGVPPGAVEVTGAQCFDQWFDRTPSRGHEAFCAHVGLPAAPRFVLYVCSALFRGSPSEARFVRRWLEGLRNSGDPALRDVPVLVRPHPSRLKEWDEVSLDGLGPVVLWGRNPIDAEAKADYFDSLSHAAAVVGLNTSAFLEAAIAGRPVLTVLLDEFHENQEGTLHFPYLLNVGGGLLYATRSLDAHQRQLGEVLADPAGHAGRSARFVEAFLRPYGLAEAATPRLVAAIERLAARPAQPADDREAGAAARAGLTLARRAYRGRLTRRLLWDPLEAREERARAAGIRAHRWMKRRQYWTAQADRARRVARERFQKAMERRAKEKAKAARWREKRVRQSRERRERLAAAVMNKLRTMIGQAPRQ
ncbi:MAG: hypothetical protein AB7O67_04255 [Vicinamibacterales bacterium]